MFTDLEKEKIREIRENVGKIDAKKLEEQMFADKMREVKEAQELKARIERELQEAKA